MFIFNLCFVACVVVGQIWLSQWSTDPTDLEEDEQRELTNYRFKIYAVILGAQGKFMFPIKCVTFDKNRSVELQNIETIVLIYHKARML